MHIIFAQINVWLVYVLILILGWDWHGKLLSVSLDFFSHVHYLQVHFLDHLWITWLAAKLQSLTFFWRLLYFWPCNLSHLFSSTPQMPYSQPSLYQKISPVWIVKLVWRRVLLILDALIVIVVSRLWGRLMRRMGRVSMASWVPLGIIWIAIWQLEERNRVLPLKDKCWRERSLKSG